MNVLRPTSSEIEFCLNKWKKLDSYVFQESSLKKLFTLTYPDNTDIDDVLIKVCSLNDFYSTNIFSPFAVAKHIVSLSIDARLKNNDLMLVNDIALIRMKENKTINFFSFATKYCSHHKPDMYPIFDSFVEKLLMHLKKTDKFAKFKKEDLKQYHNYKEIIIKFIHFYQLEKFSLKEVDRYLWIKGKEHFTKKYRSK